MKKSIQIILALSIFLVSCILPNYTIAASVIASGECGNGITWSLDTDGLLTIAGSGSMTGTTCLWEEYASQVKSVEFSDSITSISAHAFENNTNIQELILPTSLSDIGSYAFAGCTKLQNVTFPKYLRTVRDNAFYGCTSLKNIDLSSDVYTIGKNAFGGCTALENAIVRSQITVISSSDETFCSTTHLYGYSYTEVYYYARQKGRTFTDIVTNKTMTGKITKDDYLSALPTTNLKALGPTSQSGRTFKGVGLTGYSPQFAYESDTSNDNYKAIKAQVDDIVKDCKTETEKAIAVNSWVIHYISYSYGYGSKANMTGIYRIFNDKKGNCEAKSMVFNYMMYLCGIPTATVFSPGHEYAAAFVDGAWRFFDPTNGDLGPELYPPVQITFAQDNFVYMIDEPTEEPKIIGLAKKQEEIEQITSYSIPNVSKSTYMYPDTFASKVELIAELGTAGENYIRNNRLYYRVIGNQIIGTNQYANPERVILNKNKVSLKVGEETTLIATVEPYNSYSSDVSWKTSNEKKAKVDKNGKITAVGAGTVKITASLSYNLFAECELTITQDNMLGDVNGDGKITLADYAKILSHVKKTSFITDEQALIAADVNGDGKITLADYAKVLSHVKGTALLY